jgi:hypothetical protein
MSKLYSKVAIVTRVAANEWGKYKINVQDQCQLHPSIRQLARYGSLFSGLPRPIPGFTSKGTIGADWRLREGYRASGRISSKLRLGLYYRNEYHG